MPEFRVVWQYQYYQDYWIDMAEEHSCIVEEAFTRDESEVSFMGWGDQPVVIDFKTMMQSAIMSRAVRRSSLRPLSSLQATDGRVASVAYQQQHQQQKEHRQRQ